MFVAVQDPSEKSQVFVPRRGGVGEENVENFPRRGCPVLPKCTNSSPKCAKMSQFPAMENQKSKFFLACSALSGKNYNFGPEDSRPAPPRPDLTCQTLSRLTKRSGLCLSNEAGFFSGNSLSRVTPIRCDSESESELRFPRSVDLGLIRRSVN